MKPADPLEGSSMTAEQIPVADEQESSDGHGALELWYSDPVRVVAELR